MNVGFNRTFTTNDQGFFRAGQLPPGIYNITIGAISGFAEQVRENVQVNLGVITPVNFELSAQAITGEITVTADVIAVDPTDTKAQDNLSSRDIEALPKGNTFSTLLNKTSQVRSDAISGQFTINGATGPENSFIIDGQEVQNFRTGGAH